MMLIQKSFSGFTLIELMAVVVIAGILAVLAVPSFNNFLDDTQFNTRVTNLYSAILVARSEAIARDTQTTLCPSLNNIVCDTNATTNAFAAEGWIVRDSNGVIRVWDAVKVQKCGAASLVCRIQASYGGTVIPSISYNSDGTVAPINNSTTPIIAITKNGSIKYIHISAIGKPSIQSE